MFGREQQWDFVDVLQNARKEELNIKRPVMWMMVAFVLGEVAAYQMGMTVWFIIAAALFLFHRKLCPMKQKCAARIALRRDNQIKFGG